jgi:hypothetical protein
VGINTLTVAIGHRGETLLSAPNGLPQGDESGSASLLRCATFSCFLGTASRCRTSRGIHRAAAGTLINLTSAGQRTGWGPGAGRTDVGQLASRRLIAAHWCGLNRARGNQCGAIGIPANPPGNVPITSDGTGPATGFQHDRDRNDPPSASTTRWDLALRLSVPASSATSSIYVQGLMPDRITAKSGAAGRAFRRRCRPARTRPAMRRTTIRPRSVTFAGAGHAESSSCVGESRPALKRAGILNADSAATLTEGPSPGARVALTNFAAQTNGAGGDLHGRRRALRRINWRPIRRVSNPFVATSAAARRSRPTDRPTHFARLRARAGGVESSVE